MHKAYENALFFRFFAVLAAVIFLCLSSAWAGQEKGVSTVHAVGSSAIRAADMSASRYEAIDASLVSAVINTLNDILPADTLVGHFQVISENILSQTDQFIRDYKMLTESTHGNQHRVMVRATVSIQRLKKALQESGIYVGRETYPSVLFCIAEKQVNDLNFQYWWGGQKAWGADTAGAAAIRISGAKGLVIINPDATISSQTYSPQLSVPEAVALGRNLKADVVVIGEAVAEEAGDTTESIQQSYRGSVLLKAYRVGNGKEIGHAQQISMTAADDPLSGGKGALEKAAVLAAEDLSVQIIDEWFTKGGGASRVEILVEGLSGNIANFVKFRGALSSTSGVDNVQRKEMQSDTAVLLVDYQGNVQSLAEALRRQSYDTFSLKIGEPEGNILRLQLVAR